jgi:hypothetical protein
VTGSATYVGHTIANIANNGNNYIAAGTFSNTVNFGANTGTVAINGLDGTNYAGTVNILAPTTQFVGSLAGNVGGRAAGINGSFFQSPLNSLPVKNYGDMGGTILLGGTNYLGSGIFAASIPH